MPLIPEPVIDEVQSRADIAEVVGRYVTLKRAGRHFKALCPFHKEKTPSFTVNIDKQIFHCFGCGIGGNVFGFLMQHDRLTFPEAVRQLAEHMGVSVPERGENGAGSARGQTEALAALMEKVCGYFERMLAHPHQGLAAREYLDSRGVTDATRAAFRLGLAPAGWDRLLRAAGETKVSPEQLEQAGLTVRGERGSYDRFRNRLIFPIMDGRRRVIGFGGRSLDGREPKYLNSPETLLYHKGRALFGLAQAKDALTASKRAVVVEGYFDCVILAQAGIANVVSPLGTALTSEQVQLLRRYVQEVILAFDADAAGEQATLRGIDLLVEAGLEVRVAQLPQGVDPDELVRAHGGRAAIDGRLDQSLSVLDMLLACAMRRYSVDEPEGRVRAAQFVLPTIAKMPNAMLQSEYLRLVASRLRLDEEAVRRELAAARPRETAATSRARPSRSSPLGAERFAMALALDDPRRWDRVRDALTLEDLEDPLSRRMFAVIAALASNDADPTVPQVISRLTDEGQSAAVAQLVEEVDAVADKDEALESCLRRVEQQAGKRRQATLREEIRLAQDAGRDEDVTRLLGAYQVMVKGGSR